MLLFETIAGSRLYNMDHPDSDYDYWQVYANQPRRKAKYIKQKISGKNDQVVMDLSTFMLYADRSSHQVLECMFSDRANIDLIKNLRQSFRLNINTFVPLYQRTIKAFGLSESIKSKRHAVRMCWNLQQGLDYARFDPALTNEQAAWLMHATAAELDSKRLELLGQI